MDDADRADSLIEDAMQIGINKIRVSMPTGTSATECEDCEEPIPDLRRNASPGCTKCITCQTLAERR